VGAAIDTGRKLEPPMTMAGERGCRYWYLRDRLRREIPLLAFAG